MFKHGASYLQGGDFRFHCYSIPNSVDERLGPLLKNFAAECNWRFMQGYGKVLTSAHSAYICVYVFAASTERCNPLQAIRSLLGPPTGGPSRGACFAVRATRSPNPTPSYPPAEGCPRSGCPSRGARAHPATDIRSYRTHSKESGAREKSEWKMTF